VLCIIAICCCNLFVVIYIEQLKFNDILWCNVMSPHEHFCFLEGCCETLNIKMACLNLQLLSFAFILSSIWNTNNIHLFMVVPLILLLIRSIILRLYVLSRANFSGLVANAGFFHMKLAFCLRFKLTCMNPTKSYRRHSMNPDLSNPEHFVGTFPVNASHIKN
jgi:uncharacterized membrane protein